MERLTIAAGDHIGLMGTTRSGKTVLSRQLLAAVQRGIVIDPKLEFPAPGVSARSEGWRVDFHLYPWWKTFRVIWRPRRVDDERLSNLIRLAWKRKNLVLYVDELQSLTDFFPASTATLADVIRTGASRRVSVWWSAQRPYWVPRQFISEAHHKFVFTLVDEDDRDRAAKFVGPRAKVEMPMHDFLYRRVGMTDPVQATFNMKTKRIEPREGAGLEAGPLSYSREPAS